MPSKVKRVHACKTLARASANGRPRCSYCGSAVTRKVHKVSDTVRLFTMDHVVPRSQGGMFLDDNILPSCNQCNQDRGNLPLDKFIAERKYVAPGCEAFTMTVEQAREAMERAKLAHDRVDPFRQHCG